MSAVLALLGLQGGFKFGRGAVVALVCAVLVAAGGVGFWRGMAAIERMVKTAADTARRMAEAECSAEREARNAAAEREAARQARVAAEASARAEATIADLSKSLSEWEARNATRADGAERCLGPDDLRDLERLRRPSGAEGQRGVRGAQGASEREGAVRGPDAARPGNPP